LHWLLVVEWLLVSQLLGVVRLVHFKNELLSVNAHILEFNINLLNLSITQRERFSVDQVLNHGNLGEEVIISLVGNSNFELVKILKKEVIINEWHASLSWSQVKDSAADLEKICLDVILFWKSVRLNCQVILLVFNRLFKHGVSLVSFLEALLL